MFLEKAINAEYLFYSLSKIVNFLVFYSVCLSLYNLYNLILINFKIFLNFTFLSLKSA